MMLIVQCHSHFLLDHHIWTRKRNKNNVRTRLIIMKVLYCDILILSRTVLAVRQTTAIKWIFLYVYSTSEVQLRRLRFIRCDYHFKFFSKRHSLFSQVLAFKKESNTQILLKCCLRNEQRSNTTYRYHQECKTPEKRFLRLRVWRVSKTLILKIRGLWTCNKLSASSENQESWLFDDTKLV